jgi:hypothetical protein
MRRRENKEGREKGETRWEKGEEGRQNPAQLGGINDSGADIICEIDESCFRHKTKYHRGRAP